MTTVGNDIVDLTDPANREKSRDTRFLNRVFTGREQGLIRSAGRPDFVLWALWAAKEAAYKMVSKTHPGVHSIPRIYEVYLCFPEDREEAQTINGGCGFVNGEVHTPFGSIPTRIAIADDYVHCLCAESPGYLGAVIWRVYTLDADAAALPDGPSRYLRETAAREIAHRLHRLPQDIAIHRLPVPAGLGPPTVFIENRPGGIDISLSHDGRFAAWAMIISPIGKGGESSPLEYST